MGAEPKFFDINFIDRNAVLTASTGQATAGRINDRDRELQWTSVGSDDVTQETIQIDFKSAGLDLLRTFDFIAFLNHNLKDFKLQHDVGAGFIDTPGATVTGETAAYTLLPIASVANAKAVKVVMDTTQTVDDEKRVGEILVLKRLFEAPAGTAFSRLGISFRQTAKITGMFDDGIKVNQLRWAGNRIKRYNAAVGFSLLQKADYDTLLTVVDQGVFIIQPEPDQRPQEFFQVTATPNDWDANYASFFKPSGYNLVLVFEEN